MRRLPFSQNLNGLRGIAILGVFLYHLDKELFPGGWLGVNLFFILSGFLIGNILTSSQSKSYKDFQVFIVKRIFRILPTLLVIILITIPFCLILLRPNSQIEFFKSAISSQFFLSNFYFFTLDSYTADGAKFRPLLHTWSLSLEFQFYLFYSLVFFFIKFRFKCVVYSFLFIGLVFSIMDYEQSSKFFLPNFRIFEFTLGLVINYVSSSSKFSYFFLKKFQYFYLLIILASMLMVNESKIASVKWTAPFLFASFFLISSYKMDDFKSILKNKFLQFLGKISFSLYVVHFPIFALINVYLNQRLIDPSLSISIFKIVLSASISVFIHYFVELKFMKNFDSTKFKRILIFLFGLTFLVSSILIKNVNNVFQLHGFSPNINNALLEGARISQIPCWSSNNGCFINNHSKKTIFFVGDSQLASPFLEFVNLPESKNYNLFVWIRPRGINLLTSSGELPINFKEVFLSTNDEKIVVYSGRIPHYLTLEKFFNGFSYSPTENAQKLSSQTIVENINFLSQNSDHLIFVGPIPEQAWDVSNLVMANSSASQDIYYEKKYWDAYSAEFGQILDSPALLKFSYIDTTKIFCLDIYFGKCVAKLGDKIYYYDDVHLTSLGGNIVAKEILNKLLIRN